MGHDETPFRLELKDPRCGSQIKHKSNPNYEQVLFIKSHYTILAGSASDSCQEEAAVLSSLPSLSCLHFCCLHTSLQGATFFSPHISMFLFQSFAVQPLCSFSQVTISLEAFSWTAAWNVALCHNTPRWHLCVYPLNAALWKAGSLSSHVYAERQPTTSRSWIGLY